MKDKAGNTQLDALNADIAKSREDIAALAASFRRLAEWKVDKSSVDGKCPPEGPANGEKRNGKWMAFRHGLDEAGVRGMQVAKGLSDEIERHPLIGGMVAFGLGFGIARLIFRRNKSDSRQ
jgi:hypothetical protein